MSELPFLQAVLFSTSHAEILAAAQGIPLGQIIGLRLTEPEVMHTYNIKRPLELQEILDAGRLPIPVDAWIDCMDMCNFAVGYEVRHRTNLDDLEFSF